VKHVLLILIACISFGFNSCASEEKNVHNPVTATIKDSVVIARPRIYSDILFTTGAFSRSLAECANENGEYFKILSVDKLRILFYDMSFKSYEFIIPAPSTLNDLLAQISAAASSKGAVISFSPDTLGLGRLVITASGTPIQNLSVVNTTNQISASNMRTSFLWNGPIKTGVQSIGACLMFVDHSAPLLSLRDKKGALLGLELGDSIYLVSVRKDLTH